MDRHTYVCEGCSIEFYCNPQKDSANCESCKLKKNNYYFVSDRPKWAHCEYCHHQEEVVPIHCQDCGDDITNYMMYPWNTWKVHHADVCSYNQCADCGEKAGKRLQLVSKEGEMPKVRKCTRCIKDDYLISLLEKLGAK